MLFKKSHIDQLILIADISSPYAPRPGTNYTENGQNMKKELDEIESEIKEWSQDHHEKYAIALRNYCAWYVRADDRKNILEKVVFHLGKAIENNGKQSAEIELARILIEEKLVRDLDKALMIVKELEEKNELPLWMNSSIAKAKRWKGEVEIPEKVDLNNIEPSPAVFSRLLKIA